MKGHKGSWQAVHRRTQDALTKVPRLYSEQRRLVERQHLIALLTEPPRTDEA